MGAAPSGRRRQERGFALIIVLWTLALLSLLISQIAGNGRQSLQLATNLRRSASLQALADGAVQEAAFHLAAAGAGHWRPDGAVHVWREAGIEFRARLRPLAGYVNPSVASYDLMTALLQGCGLDQPRAAQIAQAVIGWRSPADTPFGLAAYQAAGRAVGPPQQPFESLDELGLVLGMTPPLLACLMPHLSLYPDTDPDPNLADPQVAAAMTAVTGAALSPNQSPPDESLARIEAVALEERGGGRASRSVVLRLQRIGSEQDAAPGGAPFRILDWSR